MKLCICGTGDRPGGLHSVACSEQWINPLVIAHDPINPPYYTSGKKFESIDVIEAYFADKPYRWAPFKYLLRAGKKPGQDEVQDLKKAIWWIEREIKFIQKL